MADWKPQHLTVLYNISLEAARQWAIEFQDYLSPTGKPGKHKHRQYTDEDMKVFSLISEMKGAGRTYEEIHLALKAGQRGDLPVMPPEQVSAIATTDRERSLVLQLSYLQQQLLAAQQELETLHQVKRELDEERNKTISLEARYEEVKRSEQELRALVSELSKQLSREYIEGYKAGLKDRDEE